MLADLTPNIQEIERRKQVSKEHNFEFISQCDPELKHGTGVYRCNFDFNFSHEEFEEFKGCANIPFDKSYEAFKPNNNKSQYGVADSIEQIMEYFKEQVEDKENKYFISLTPVFQYKENKGKSGGWRWCKWGPYIGKLDSKCEYLDDEDFGDDFKYIICFHLYKIN